MREIKFRAWKKDTNGYDMHYSEGLNCCDWDTKSDEAIVMQYTGLKDKNGKEIYEGDIVSSEGWGSIIITWDDAQSFSLSEDYGMYAYDFIIIGNIYENPELLSSN